MTAQARPRISIVVPFRNNADVLGDCLKSIAEQTFGDFEVLMVDDGSTDGGDQVAAARAAADPRFVLLDVPPGGSPGYARNQGIARATGEYLSFVDGDDMLPPHALERLLHTLAASGSDFVSGGAERVGPMGVTPSYLHGQAIKGKRTGTHISRRPELFFDVSVWNKLFRKSFWDRHGLVFPEGVVWEDLQLMTKAHVLARAVDTIPEPIYYWRERGAGALSITQSRTAIENFRDRITAFEVIDEFLRGRGEARLVREHQHKALLNDLWLYVPDLGRATDAYRAEFCDRTARYLAQVDQRVLRRLPSMHKLAYHLISRGLVPELLEFVGWLADQPILTVPLVREHGRVRADLPFRNRRDLAIPAAVYRPSWRELDPFVRVEDIDWAEGKLVISGCAFVPSLDIRKRRHTSKIVILWPRGRIRLPVIVPARSFRHAEAKRWSGQDRYDYDWAGFTARISPRWFRLGRRWLPGDWDGYVLVRGRGIWRGSRLHTPVPGSAERPPARQVAPGIRLGARWAGRRLHVQLVRTPAELSRCEMAGRDLVLEADLRSAGAWSAGARPAELAVRRPHGTAVRRLATTMQPAANGLRLRGVLPGELLAGNDDWDLFVASPGENAVRVAFPDHGREFSFRDGAHEVAVERTRYGNVMISRRPPGPVLEEHAWSEGGVLTLRGSYPGGPAGPGGPGGELAAVLVRSGATETHVLPVRREGDRFEVTLPAAAMPSFGRALPLRDGLWQLRLRPPGQAAGHGDLIPRYDHARLAAVRDEKLQFGPKIYKFTTTEYDIPVLSVGPALGFAAHGRIGRKVLRDMYYPLQQRRQVRDCVVFVSFNGRQASDNPLGIAAELRRRGDDREHVWAVTDYAVPVPDGATAVLIGTESYWDALARSKYLISNDDMPAGYTKRPGQVYVQTWHGTPLKRIGFDVENLRSANGSKYLDHLARDIAKWDLLLSPNPFSTPILRSAFRFAGEICESGYPRNDVLGAATADVLAEQVRGRLGLPAGKRAILYAPTWRDNQYYASGRYRFDLRLDLERAWRQLGGDYVILLRGHHQMADDVPEGRPGFVRNVTNYPDVAELFLVSDVLITDYSSMMCDFAATGKPIICYAYDLAEYRDDLRGFYVDLAAEAPGPLLTTSDEVIAAVAGLDRLAASYQAKYRAFAAKFCPLDDGKAGARACDRIFGIT